MSNILKGKKVIYSSEKATPTSTTTFLTKGESISMKIDKELKNTNYSSVFGKSVFFSSS